MKKTNELLKLLIPAMLIATAVAIIFASLALCLTYTPEDGNINMKTGYAVIFVITLLIALIVPFFFIIAFKDMKITRTRRDLKFGKIASLLVAISVFAYSISDMIYMTSGKFQAWRFLRVLAAIFVIIFAIIEFLPSKIKISTFAKNFTNGCVPIYTAFSILALYFDPTSIPEYFKILYTIAYAILTLFVLYDFKWRLVTTNAKAYTAISTMAFALPVIISLSSISGFIFRNNDLKQENIVVSIFEMILVLTFGIYALSKVFAIKATVNYVVAETQKRLEAKAEKERQRLAEEDAKFEARKAELNKQNENKANKPSSSTDNQ